MLSLYNTASHSIEPIKPIMDGKIGMYCCGPTVYGRAHIGNLRTFVTEDVLRRVLERIEGFEVKHVMNITDVGHLVGDEDEGEDKMEKSSRETGKSAWEIAKEYEAHFFRDCEALNVLRPTVTPRATDRIADQIELIKLLEEKGFTYRISDGIYFDTFKFPGYGKLGGQKLEEKKEGARVMVNSEKKHPTDFALWKFSPEGVKRQMEWNSPWGIGFPGWHIECSAMSQKELGQPFDIHCGGVDHIPVHHENEIAQSESAYGVPLARHWLHGEFLTVDGQKMSKSIGNVYTLDDLSEKGYSPLMLRLFFLGANYRSKLNFTWDALEGVKRTYEKMVREVREWDDSTGQGIGELEVEFRNALEDDLNTSKALAILWKLIDSDHDTSSKRASIEFMDGILGLGLFGLKKEAIFIPEHITILAEERLKAKARKDWDESDRLRKELDGHGWIVKDAKDGYELERKN